MSGVRVSENLPVSAGCVELAQRKVRSIFYSPSNNNALQRKHRKNGSLPNARWNFLLQTVSRKAYAYPDPINRELEPAAMLLKDAVIAVLIPLKEFETCR